MGENHISDKRLMSQTFEDLTKLERKQTLKMVKGIDIS